MATTQKGIYYPDDYTAIADVPEDMKDLAESVDTALGNLEDNIEQNIQPQIDDIEEEQTTQNNEIEALQTENTRLKATLPTTTGTGENITLSKTAELEFIQPPLPRGNSEQATSILPTGYTQLDYIESTGTQYIDTGFKPTQNTTKVIIDGMYLSSNMNYFAGLVDSGIYYGIRPANVTGALDWHNAISSIRVYYDYLNTILNYKYDGYKFYINNELEADFSTGSNTHFDINLYLFARNNSGTADAKSQFRMYSCKIYDNTTLVRDYIPCKNASNEVGLYDLVTKTFFGNNGTGTFTAGNTVTIPNPSFPQEITNVTGDVEVLVQNKNLFDKNNANIINGYFTTTANITSNENHRTIYIPVKSNTTYTIQKSNAGGDNSRFGIGTTAELPTVGTAVSQVTINNSATSLAITTNATAKYLVVWCYFTSNTAITELNLLSTIQIEVGSTATTYTPHQEQTFTFPLGTQRMYLGDYLADDGIHHVRKQVVLVGTEQWFGFRGSGDDYSYRVFGVSNVINANKNAEIMSDYFMKNMSAVLDANNNGIYIYANNTIYISIDKSLIANVEPSSFKTWLRTHNVTVEYELATEEITPYTTEQQQAYDEISQAISYEEQTNISGSSDESNPIFSVEAYQSTKLILEEISNAVVALGGV